MKPVIFLLAATLAFSTAGLGATSSSSPVLALLAQPIIETNLPLSEVEDFVERRIPRMVPAKTVAEWEKLANQMRKDVLDRVIYRGEAVQWRDGKVKTEWLETIEGGPGYHIRKLRYEALPGLWIPALLYLPDRLSPQMPVYMAVNGHDANGKQAPYKQIRCINLAKRGVIALNVEWFNMGQLRGPGFNHAAMNQIDLCGSGGIAPYFLAMKRGLDILLALPNADPERVAVSGLSGGGWQTIFISSLDTRVKLTNPVAGYSSFLTRVRYHTDLGDSEQTPCDLATVADYAHLTAMMAPRATLLTFNAADNCCFASPHALIPLQDAASPIFDLYGRADRLRAHVNFDPGTHNYEKDNREAFYDMVGDCFFTGDKTFQRTEIPSDSEVKTREQLNVELPAGNLDFNKLALGLSANLPRDPAVPSEPGARRKWQRDRRELLAGIVGAKNYQVLAEQAGREEANGYRSIRLKLRMAGEWTVPAVDISRNDARETVILVADAGRASVAARAEELLAAGKRVLAVDPYYFGESKLGRRDYLFDLMLATVGERALGIQAGQLSAIARWAVHAHKSGPVTIEAHGPRSSAFSLVAAALEEKAIGSVELHSALTSLKQLIQRNETVDKMPEMFCFGLLEFFDLPQLKALVEPRPVMVQ